MRESDEGKSDGKSQVVSGLEAAINLSGWGTFEANEPVCHIVRLTIMGTPRWNWW